MTQLRPFLSWARTRGVAAQLVLGTGVAAIGEPSACPAGQLALLDGDWVSSMVALE